MKMEQCFPKRRHIKFRRRGITQKKTYNNSVFIYISLSVGVWWRVGNTKLLKHKKKNITNKICFLWIKSKLSLFQIHFFLDVTRNAWVYHCMVLPLHNRYINPLNAKLNPICHLLALLGAHLIFHVSRIRVN